MKGLYQKRSIGKTVRDLFVIATTIFGFGCVSINYQDVNTPAKNPFLPAGQTRAKVGNAWYTRIGDTDYAVECKRSISALAQKIADKRAETLRNFSMGGLSTIDENGDMIIDADEYSRHTLSPP